MLRPCHNPRLSVSKVYVNVLTWYWDISLKFSDLRYWQEKSDSLLFKLLLQTSLFCSLLCLFLVMLTRGEFSPC